MKAMFSMFATVPDNTKVAKAPRRAPKRRAFAPCTVYRPDENGEMRVAEIIVSKSRAKPAHG